MEKPNVTNGVLERISSRHARLFTESVLTRIVNLRGSSSIDPKVLLHRELTTGYAQPVVMDEARERSDIRTIVDRHAYITALEAIAHGYVLSAINVDERLAEILEIERDSDRTIFRDLALTEENDTVVVIRSGVHVGGFIIPGMNSNEEDIVAEPLTVSFQSFPKEEKISYWASTRDFDKNTALIPTLSAALCEDVLRLRSI